MGSLSTAVSNTSSPIAGNDEPVFKMPDLSASQQNAANRIIDESNKEVAVPGDDSGSEGVSISPEVSNMSLEELAVAAENTEFNQNITSLIDSQLAGDDEGVSLAYEIPTTQIFGRANTSEDVEGHYSDAKFLFAKEVWEDGFLGYLGKKAGGQSGQYFKDPMQEIYDANKLDAYKQNSSWGEQLAIGMIPGFLSDLPLELIPYAGMGFVAKAFSRVAKTALRAKHLTKAQRTARFAKFSELARTSDMLSRATVGELGSTVPKQALSTLIAGGAIGLVSVKSQELMGKDLRPGEYTERMIGDALGGTIFWGALRTLSAALGSKAFQGALKKTGIKEDVAKGLDNVLKKETTDEDGTGGKLTEIDSKDSVATSNGKDIALAKVGTEVAEKNSVSYKSEKLNGPVDNEWRSDPFIASTVDALVESGRKVFFVKGAADEVNGQYDPNTQTVIINSGKSVKRQMHTLGHEGTHVAFDKLKDGQKETVLDNMIRVVEKNMGDNSAETPMDVLTARYKAAISKGDKISAQSTKRKIVEEFLADYGGSSDTLVNRLKDLEKRMSGTEADRSAFKSFLSSIISYFKSIRTNLKLMSPEGADAAKSLDRMLKDVFDEDTSKFLKEFVDNDGTYKKGIDDSPASKGDGDDDDILFSEGDPDGDPYGEKDYGTDDSDGIRSNSGPTEMEANSGIRTTDYDLVPVLEDALDADGKPIIKKNKDGKDSIVKKPVIKKDKYGKPYVAKKIGSAKEKLDPISEGKYGGDRGRTIGKDDYTPNFGEISEPNMGDIVVAALDFRDTMKVKKRKLKANLKMRTPKALEKIIAYDKKMIEAFKNKWGRDYRDVLDGVGTRADYNDGVAKLKADRKKNTVTADEWLAGKRVSEPKTPKIESPTDSAKRQRSDRLRERVKADSKAEQKSIDMEKDLAKKTRENSKWLRDRDLSNLSDKATSRLSEIVKTKRGIRSLIEVIDKQVGDIKAREIDPNHVGDGDNLSLHDSEKFLFAAREALKDGSITNKMRKDLRIASGRLVEHVKMLEDTSQRTPIMSKTMPEAEPGNQLVNFAEVDSNEFETGGSGKNPTVDMKYSSGDPSQRIEIDKKKDLGADDKNPFRSGVFKYASQLYKNALDSRAQGFEDDAVASSEFTDSGEAELIRGVANKALHTIMRIASKDGEHLYGRNNFVDIENSNFSAGELADFDSEFDLESIIGDIQEKTGSFIMDDHAEFLQDLIKVDINKDSSLKPREVDNYTRQADGGDVNSGESYYDHDKANDVISTIVAGIESGRKRDLSIDEIESVSAAVKADLNSRAVEIHFDEINKLAQATHDDIISKGGTAAAALDGKKAIIYNNSLKITNLADAMKFAGMKPDSKYYNAIIRAMRMAEDARSNATMHDVGSVDDWFNKALSKKGVSKTDYARANFRNLGGLVWGAKKLYGKLTGKTGLVTKEYGQLGNLTEIEAQTMYARMESAMEAYKNSGDTSQLEMMSKNDFIPPENMEKAAVWGTQLSGFDNFARHLIDGDAIDDAGIEVQNLYQSLKDTNDNAVLDSKFLIDMIRSKNKVTEDAIHAGSFLDRPETLSIPMLRITKSKTGEYDIKAAAKDRRFDKTDYGASAAELHYVGDGILIQPLLSLAMKSILEGNHIAAHAGPLRTALAIHTNSKFLSSLKGLAGDAYNAKAKRVLDNIRYPDRSGIDFGEHGNIIKAAYNASTIGILGANPKIALNQVWSSAMLIPKYGKSIYLANAGRNTIPSVFKATLERIMEHGGGQYKARATSFTAGRTDLGDISADRGLSNEITGSDEMAKGLTLPGLFMSLIGRVDKVVMFDNWNMAEAHVTKNTGLTAKDGDKYWSEVREMAQKTADETQPTHSEYNKNDYQNSDKAFTRTIMGRFTSATSKNSSNLVGAYSEAMMYKDYAPIKQWGAVIASMSAGIAATDVAYSMAADAGGDEAAQKRAVKMKDELVKQYILSFVNRSLGISPITGAAGGVLSTALGGKYYPGSLPGGDVMESLNGLVAQMADQISGDSPPTRSMIRNWSRAFRAIGIPVPAILKAIDVGRGVGRIAGGGL